MGSLTLTPSGRLYEPAGWTTAGGNADVVVADANDATYVQGPTYAPDPARGLILGLTNGTIPAGALIVGVRVRTRAKDLSTYPWDSQGRIYLALPGASLGSYVATAYGQTAITDYTGGYGTSQPGGGPWTQQGLDDLQLIFTTYTDYFGSGIRFYMAAVDVLYNERPVVTPTAVSPFGASRPSVSWTIADPEGDPQQAYDVAWFSSAVYSAGGFDPATSGAAVYRSFEVTSTTQNHQIPVDLVNGTTYKAYVRVRQPDVSGQAHWSEWAASNAVTINVTPPAAPTLAAINNSTNWAVARNIFTATKNNSESGTRLIIEYSDDHGVSWKVHPAMADVTFTGTTTLGDYEFPLGLARRYRAKVVVGNGTVGSAYSNVITPTVPGVAYQKWWLKDPYDPIFNISPRISDFSIAAPRPQAVHDPIGRTEHVVITEGVQGATGSFTIQTHSQIEYVALRALTGSGRVLLLQSVHGQQWYVQLGESDDYELVHAKDPTNAFVVRHFYRARFTWREVARQQV